MRRDGKGLGRTQRLVLLLLLDEPAKSCRMLAYDWPTLTQAAAHSALERLGALVDAAGRDEYGGGRTYTLTARGEEVARAVAGIEAEDNG